MDKSLVLLLVFLLVILVVAVILLLRRTKKHWIKNKSAEGLPGLDIVVGQVEDTTFNKLKTAADGSFNFNFRLGQASISVVEPALGIKEIVGHPEVSVDNHGDATFNIKNTSESIVFIVAPLGHTRKKPRTKKGK